MFVIYLIIYFYFYKREMVTRPRNAQIVSFLENV